MAAYYLVSMFAETAARGLVGECAVTIRSQRAALGEPLDDLIMEGRQGADQTRLSLQLKSQVSFTQKNEDWSDCVRRSWDTVIANEFDPTFHRVGIAIATLNAKADAHYRTVLNWARDSASGSDFVRRITLNDFSHSTRTDFVDDVRQILSAHIGTPATDDELWKLLRSFVILHFDFNADASSGDDSAAVATLQASLAAADRGRARDIWNALDTLAGRMIPNAGSLERDQLIERLRQDGLPATPTVSLQKDLAAIDAESRRALREIRSTIGDLKLHRRAAIEEFSNGADGNRFVQFVSEPGAGKSAVLREIAERYGAEGPLFVLKNDRVHPRGWPAHAANLQISGDLDALISGLATAGAPILFIDGIDRVSDPAAQVTVNDILRAIVASPTEASWLVVATVREQNLRHLETWLDRDVIARLGVRTITIKPLSAEERQVVATHIPRLRALLGAGHPMNVLLSRPFFLEAILRLSPASGNLPASEAELLDLWWELGGANDPSFATAQRRRDALMGLARQAATLPNTPLSIDGLDAQAVDELRTADVLRDHLLGHSVQFTHDIYEEWALAEMLLRHQADLPSLLSEFGEPQTLVRAAQLIATRALEHDHSGSDWLSLLTSVQRDDLRPVWHRAMLTAPLHSTRTVELLTGLAPHFFDLANGLLAKLFVAVRTVEVIPNQSILDHPGFDIDYEDRVKLAQHAALPKGQVWVRFFEWLIPQLNDLPLVLVPDLLPVLATWQGAFGGYNVRFSEEIGVAARRWLREAEEGFHPQRFEDRRDPFGELLRYEDEKKLEKGLRALLLSSAGDSPDEVTAYLSERLADDGRLHMVRDDILSNSGKVAQHLPTQLVDFLLGALISRPRDNRRRFGDDDILSGRHFGLEDDHAFYPSSPLKPPFLALLRNHPDEGLRLIHGLTNHATEFWRRSYATRNWTPIPMDLEFPWGQQRFWGDETVYVWFRGQGSSHVIETALMALEQWSLEELERGVAVDDQLARILKDSECVALLGIAVSLSLAAGAASVPVSLPLVMQPRLWGWDIRRHVNDMSTPANEIGNWAHDRVYLEAVRKLNRKPHRQYDVRTLVGYYVISDEATRDLYEERWVGFEANLPFDIEEQKNSEEQAAEIAEKNRMFAQQADLKNWFVVRSESGNQYELRIAPPYAGEEKHQKQIAEQAERDIALGLALWAEKSRESDAIDPRLTVDQALKRAREADHESLFDYEDETGFDDNRYLAAGVVGTAYVAARHLPEEGWTAEIGTWCLDIFQRAATRPEAANVGGRGSHLMMSAQVFAAYGYSALLARAFEAEQCKLALLSLAVDVMEGVETAVYQSASLYAQRHPPFLYALLQLALWRCLHEDGDYSDHYSVVWSETEAERELALLAEAEAAVGSGVLSPLPAIPMPWIPGGSADEETGGYAWNDRRFNYRLAQRTLLHLPIQPLLQDPFTRSETVQLVHELIAYTGQRIVPPFAQNRREHRGNTPFEWIYSFSAWSGRIAAALDDPNISEALFDRIAALQDDAAFFILEGFMRLYMVDALLKPVTIAAEKIAFWRRMTNWLFDHREARNALNDGHLDREYQNCAFTTLFCASMDFSLVCGADRGWANITLFEDIVGTAIAKFGGHETLFLGVAKLLKQAGLAFFPEPAFEWLRGIAIARRSDQDFWDGNGDLMVDILKAALADDSRLALTHGPAIMFIADVLVDNGVRGAGFLQQGLTKEGH